jgi:alpha-tubulin suppressor-like RCC1 family protein
MTGPIKLYYIWYGDWSDNTAAQDILENLANNLGGSPYWGINTLYDDRYGGHVSSKVVFGGSTFDSGSDGTDIRHTDDIVRHAIAANPSWADPNAVYFVLGASNIEEHWGNSSTGFCEEYCGYHYFGNLDSSNTSSLTMKFAFVGSPDSCVSHQNSGRCDITWSPNHNGADAMASAIAHELSETATDPQVDAWGGGADHSANENADHCEYQWGRTYDSEEPNPNGAQQANVRLGFYNYLLQENWVPIAAGYCGMSYPHQPISVGPTHTLAVQTNGSLWAWGKNDRGQLGDGTTTTRLKPVMIAPGGAGLRWVSVAAGNKFSVGLTSGGDVFTWGDRSVGQLGDGIGSTIQTTPQFVGNGFTAVRAGDQYVVAVKDDGTLWSWGYNANGQLGVNDQSIHGYPTQEATYRPSPGWAPWAQVTAGAAHTIATSAAGEVYDWGWNDWGTLGLGDTGPRLTPDSLWVSAPAAWYRFSGGYDFSLGLGSDGTLWSWGHNQAGQLGTSSGSFYARPRQFIGGNTWEAVAAGNRHGMAVRGDGTVWTWGSNSNGQLGTGVAVGTSAAPVTRESTKATNWVSVFGRQDSSIAVKVDGSVYGWGNNTSGQLGLGDTTSRNAPTPLSWTMSVPSVDVTGPTDGSSYQTASNVPSLTVSASATGGRITKVDFYVGATLIGTDTTSPYSVSWNIASYPPGSYQLSARATNVGGQLGYSTPITVGLYKLAVTATDLAAGAIVDFSTEGKLDWFHVGLNGTDPNNAEVKNVSSHVLSGFNFTGPGGYNVFLQDTTNLTVTWRNDGVPTPTASTKVGIKTKSPVGGGFFGLLADASTTTDRVLSMYFKLVNANASFVADLESAHTVPQPADWTNAGSTTPKYRVYRVTYRGSLPAGSSLSALASLKNVPSNGSGNLTFLGATLH